MACLNGIFRPTLLPFADVCAPAASCGESYALSAPSSLGNYGPPRAASNTSFFGESLHGRLFCLRRLSPVVPRVGIRAQSSFYKYQEPCLIDVTTQESNNGGSSLFKLESARPHDRFLEFVLAREHSRDVVTPHQISKFGGLHDVADVDVDTTCPRRFKDGLITNARNDLSQEPWMYHHNRKAAPFFDNAFVGIESGFLFKDLTPLSESKASGCMSVGLLGNSLFLARAATGIINADLALESGYKFRGAPDAMMAIEMLPTRPNVYRHMKKKSKPLGMKQATIEKQQVGVEKKRKKNPSSKPWKPSRKMTTAHSRGDVLERSGSNVRLYEILLRAPFTSPSRAAAPSFPSLSRRHLANLTCGFNQVAAGLAGCGLALLLFVVSRMLSVNATLDGLKVATLVRGAALIWLSSAVRRLGGAVRDLAAAGDKEKFERRQQICKYKNELKSIVLKVCTVAAFSMVRLV